MHLRQPSQRLLRKPNVDVQITYSKYHIQTCKPTPIKNTFYKFVHDIMCVYMIRVSKLFGHLHWVYATSELMVVLHAAFTEDYLCNKIKNAYQRDVN